MPEFRKLFSHVLPLLLIAVVLIPRLVLAAPNSPKPCTQFLESVTTDKDRPYIDLYIQSLVAPKNADKRLPKLANILDPKATPARYAVYLMAQYNIEQAEGDNETKVQGYISQLKQLGKQTESDWMIAEALLYEAVELVDKRNYELAELSLPVVINSAKELDYPSLLARALKWQGNIAIGRSEYKRGLKKYQDAYEIFADCGDDLQLSRVLSNISLVYIRMEEWTKADYYLNQALDLYKKSAFANPFAEAILHINGSIVDKHLERPEERLEHIHQAMKLAAKTSSYRIKLTALINLAAVQIDRNESKEALQSAKSCVRLAESYREPSGIAYCNESFGEAYLQLGEYDMALHHTFLALNAYQQRGERNRYIYTSNIIADIYEAAGDYKKALKYYKQFASDGKEYLFDSRRKELFDLQDRFDAQVKEHEITLLKTENALQMARLAEKKASENMLRVGIAFILLCLYLLYRRYSNISRNNLALEKSNAKLTTQSMQDPLTGLYNRRYFEEWLQSLPPERFGSGGLLIVLDIDHFKAINDRLGHDVGDQVLTLLAARLAGSIGSDDLVMRWGGEEFVLIVTTPEHEINMVLEGLRRVVAEEKFETSAGDVAVSVSLGAVFASSAESLKQGWKPMLVDADKALYNVKSAGRNGFQLSTSST